MDSNQRRKKITLDEIPRINIFKVPDGYFDELPGIIQSRISRPAVDTETIGSFRMGWKLGLVLSTFTLIAVFTILFRGGNIGISSANEILADVPVEDIIAYLETTDITADEILAELNMEDLTAESFLEEDFELLDDDEILELDDSRLYEQFGLDPEDVF